MVRFLLVAYMHLGPLALFFHHTALAMYTPAGPQRSIPNRLLQQPSESMLHATAMPQLSLGSPCNAIIDRPSLQALEHTFNPYYHQYQGPEISTGPRHA